MTTGGVFPGSVPELRNEIEARDASGLERATDRAAEAVARRFGTGAVEARMRAIVIEAVC